MADDYFTADDRRKIIRLLDHLDRYLTEPARPALVHGDLWSGNMIVGNDGKGWLIDPAVYFGHPEADLAMTELFGGFSARFYAGYREAFPPAYGYEDRRDLYNLYHLLNHLNLFGGGYLYSVKSVISRYV
jgi:fructosamine-3-kinase